MYKGGFAGYSHVSLNGKNNKSENGVKPDIGYDEGTGGSVEDMVY
jgi:hypothetical protein